MTARVKSAYRDDPQAWLRGRGGYADPPIFSPRRRATIVGLALLTAWFLSWSTPTPTNSQRGQWERACTTRTGHGCETRP